MDKEKTREQIRNYLLDQKEILFAYVYGSFISGKKFRDIDLGIYTKREIDLLRLGQLKSELSKLIDTESDIVILNDVFKHQPVFAFEVVTHGDLLFTRNPGEHKKFKKRVLLQFFDTQYLRESVNRAFDIRVEKNRFGDRDYVT